MARRIAAGTLTTTWFARHGATPVTEVPARWPETYRVLVEQRIARIEQDRDIGLLERPEYKRRWNREPWATREQRALRERLLTRLERPACWPEPALQSSRRLAARAADARFMLLAELYRGHPDFDVAALVDELVAAESVPFLPVLRYKPSGLRKRAVWEQTWALQRREDAIDAEVAAAWDLGRRSAGGDPDDGRGLDYDYDNDNDGTARDAAIAAEQRRRRVAEIGEIPPPPKYRSADFLRADWWRLRGALDVPKERFIAYPPASTTADPSLVIGWAGWDHLAQAHALAAHYLHLKEQEGFTAVQLTPLLAGLLELVPWLKQWHNAADPDYGIGMGDYFAGFIARRPASCASPPSRFAAGARRRPFVAAAARGPERRRFGALDEGWDRCALVAAVR